MRLRDDSLYKLEITSKELLDLDFSRCIPSSDYGFVYFYNQHVSVIIDNLNDGRGKFFDLKEVKKAYPEAFGKNERPDEVRVREWYARQDLNIERYLSKKDDFLYFDKYEQDAIKSVMSGNILTGSVRIINRMSTDSVWAHKEMLNSTQKEMDLIFERLLRNLGVVVVTQPQVFYELYKNSDASDNYKDLLDASDYAIQTAFAKYSALQDITTIEEFKFYTNQLLKVNHPDSIAAEGSQREIEEATSFFMRLNADIEDLRNSYWYMKLEGNEEMIKNHETKHGKLKYLQGFVLDEKEVIKTDDEQ